jgi:hypothetical protein
VGKGEHSRRLFLSVYYKSTRTKTKTHFDATQSHKCLRLVEKLIIIYYHGARTIRRSDIIQL